MPLDIFFERNLYVFGYWMNMCNPIQSKPFSLHFWTDLFGTSSNVCELIEFIKNHKQNDMYHFVVEICSLSKKCTLVLGLLSASYFLFLLLQIHLLCVVQLVCFLCHVFECRQYFAHWLLSQEPYKHDANKC